MKTIPSFPNYMATKDGRIYSIKNKRFLSLKSESKGYQKCNLYNENGVKNVRVHRVVWEAFNGAIPDGYEVNHKNEIRNDNRFENLELLTHHQNLMYGNGNAKRQKKQIELVRRGGDSNFARPITLIIDDKEYYFSSRTEAASFLNIRSHQLTYKMRYMRTKNLDYILVNENIVGIKKGC